jgi:hypothetical protein
MSKNEKPNKVLKNNSYNHQCDHNALNFDETGKKVLTIKILGILSAFLAFYILEHFRTKKMPKMPT